MSLAFISRYLYLLFVVEFNVSTLGAIRVVKVSFGSINSMGD